MSNLGNTLHLSGKDEEASKLLREAMDGLSRSLGDAVAPAMEARRRLSLTYLKLQRIDEAVALSKSGYDIVAQKVKPATLLSLRTRQHYAAMLLRANRAADAEPIVREAIAIAETMPQSNADVFGELRNTLAEVLEAKGRKSP
jgi:hypothetical protein